MKNVIFSIVSHNQQDLVASLVESIDNYVVSGSFVLKIVITENSVRHCGVKSRKFSTDCIVNLRPKGFGANHNSAFECAPSDYFFILNPDIKFISPVNLDLILTFFSAANLDVGSPVILNSFNEVVDYKRENLNLFNLVKRKIFKRNYDRFDWFAGMFLVVKSTSFFRLKGFDTKFFMYVEDCDLCMRARYLNMKVEDLNMFSVVHDAQRASHRSIKYLYWHVSSLIKYWLS